MASPLSRAPHFPPLPHNRIARGGDPAPGRDLEAFEAVYPTNSVVAVVVVDVRA